MMGTRFVVDTNALSRLGHAHRASQRFRECCRIPTLVLEEARGFRDVDSLADLEYQTTAKVIDFVRKVMSTVEPGDTSLVDLYANRGGADPFVLACALDGSEEAAAGLFGHTWVVVSDDKALGRKAQEFGLKVWTTAELSMAIENASDG